MMKNITKIILSLGLIFLSAGLVLYIISSNLWMYALVPGVVGLILLGYWIFINRSFVKDFFVQPATIYRGNAFLLAIIVVLIVGFLNAILYRHYLRWDLTEQKLFSLSDSTLKELDHLEKLIEEKKKAGEKDPFEVIAFVNSEAPQKRDVEELLEEYAYYAKGFKYRVVDPDKNPTLAEKYKVKSYNIAVVRFGSKTIQVRDINENNLTNGIIKVTRAGTVKICFVAGHGEVDLTGQDQRRSMTEAKKALDAQGFKVKTIHLASYEKIEDLKKDCNVVVVAGPQGPLLESELKLLDEYLNTGGKAMFMLDPNAPTRLGSVLQKWGIQVDDTYVVDLNALSQVIGSGPVTPLGVQYDRFHEITKGFQYMTFFPLARSLSKTSKTPEKVSVTELVKTGGSAWADFDFVEELQKDKPHFTPGRDRKGPITLAMAAEGNPAGTPKGTTETKTRIVVVGDSDFATDNYFSSEVEGKSVVQPNGDLFLNMVNWLAEQKDLISIRPKERKAAQIILPATGERTVSVLTLFVMPLLVAAGGLVAWIRKRYL